MDQSFILKADFDGVHYRLRVRLHVGAGEVVGLLSKNERGKVCAVFLDEAGGVTRTVEINDPRGFLPHLTDAEARDLEREIMEGD